MPIMLNLDLADRPTQDLVGRFALLVELCEWFITEAVDDMPADLNTPMVLILGRMARSNGVAFSAGELRSKGFYIGSNVTYNLNRLVERGYINSQKNMQDGRSVLLTLTQKGLAVGKPVAEAMKYIDEHVGSVFSPEAFRKAKGFLGESLHTDLNVREKEHA